MGEGHLSWVEVENREPTQLGSESEGFTPRDRFAHVALIRLMYEGREDIGQQFGTLQILRCSW